MRTRFRPRGTGLGLVMLLLSAAAGGCAGGYKQVRPTLLDRATQEVPESALLDVGVSITEGKDLAPKKLVKQGTTNAIRQAECYFLPYHLKNTLQASSHWGSVQVVPPDDDFVDVQVTSELIESNGETMKLAVEAVDSTGRVWLSRKYHAAMKAENYDGTVEGEREACQDLFNMVANDLAAFRRTLSPDQIEEIRTVTALRFAADFAPAAFDDYLAEDRKGRLVIRRLPADDDPLWHRVEAIRGREQMFVETLNQYYEGYYLRMWAPYEDWRRYYVVEQVARREAERDAFFRTLGGILMVAGAIALQAADVPNSGAASAVLVVAGGQVIVSGLNVSEQVKIHKEAIKELAESFGAEMEPTVVELEGKQYELTGTAAEQYRSWRELLHRIYYEETGFDADAP